MKPSGLWLIVLTSAITSWTANNLFAQQPAPPAVTVDSALAFDAQTQTATAKVGEPQAHFTFNLTNVANVPVTINSVATSCGCTAAKLPAQPWTLAPGSNGQINVTMNLAGKPVGDTTKVVTLNTDKGSKMVFVRVTIVAPPKPSSSEMTPILRQANQKIAMADRQAVFKGDCAKCHVEPASGKQGAELYASACGICHDSKQRAPMVPNLKVLAETTNADFWRNWIRQGKPGSLMPAFAKSEGGILDDEQIASLANYLAATIPSHPAHMAVN